MQTPVVRLEVPSVFGKQWQLENAATFGVYHPYDLKLSHQFIFACAASPEFELQTQT
jgi:hypothetical protein